MTKQKSLYSAVNNRHFSTEPRHHISLILYSNSGGMALKNKEYRIVIDENRALSGNTDCDGFLHHDNVPSGDFRLILDNGQYETKIPSLPIDQERYPVRLPGYFLLHEADFENLDRETGSFVDYNNFFYRPRPEQTTHRTDEDLFTDLEDPMNFESDIED